MCRRSVSTRMTAPWEEDEVRLKSVRRSKFMNQKRLWFTAWLHVILGFFHTQPFDLSPKARTASPPEKHSFIRLMANWLHSLGAPHTFLRKICRCRVTSVRVFSKHSQALQSEREPLMTTSPRGKERGEGWRTRTMQLARVWAYVRGALPTPGGGNSSPLEHIAKPCQVT